VFENIYATNVFKYFYSFPPERTMNVLYQHLEPNLDLLKEELSAYPKAAIITLGLPVLRLLSDRDDEVYKYWDYDKKTHETLGRFACCKASKNNLGRDIYPLPHQPSLVKEFYKGNLDGYLKYVRNEIRK
jgi:uracil-DNA glycosylase